MPAHSSQFGFTSNVSVTEQFKPVKLYNILTEIFIRQSVDFERARTG